MNSKVLIITGMHRSGTSVLTQWLNRCGLFIGNKLVGPDLGNVQGHFEDCEFLNLHQEFLKKRKLADVGFVNRPFPELSISETDQVENLVETRNKEHYTWGWKDPRTCLFLDMYRKIIPSARYIIIVRGYNSTVSSLVRREHKMILKKLKSKDYLSKLKWRLFRKKKLERPFEYFSERFLRIWVYYYQQIFKHIDRLPPDSYRFVHYDQLLQNDSEVFNKMTNDWDFSLQYVPFSDISRSDLTSEGQNIERYITDKALLEKAKAIERWTHDLLHPVKAEFV